MSIKLPFKIILRRRQFLTLLGIGVWATQLGKSRLSYAHSPSLLKPLRLQKGDTIGLISPANQIKAEEVEPVVDFLSDKGFRVKLGEHIFDQYGYLAGKDEARAGDVNLDGANDILYQNESSGQLLYFDGNNQDLGTVPEFLNS